MKDYIEDNAFLDKAVKKIPEDQFGDEEIQEIESKRRDGFIPDYSNHGGYFIRRIIPMDFIYDSSDEKLNAAIEENRKENQQYVAKELKEKYKELKDWSLGSINLSRLEEEGLDEIASEYEELSASYGEEDTVLLEVRIMYHGENEEKEHSFTVDSVINWNSPYHRDLSSMQSFEEIEIQGSSKNVIAEVRSAVEKVSKEIKDILGNL